MNTKQTSPLKQPETLQIYRKIDSLSNNGPLLIAYRKKTVDPKEKTPSEKPDELMALFKNLLST